MKDGFTIDQAQAMRKSAGAVAGDRDDDFEKCAALSADLVSALGGAGVGAGLGLVSDAIRPADEDEDRFKRRLVSLLSGAVLGGAAGYGLRKARENIPAIAPEKKAPVWSRITEALDPDISTVAAVGGLGYGLSPTFSRGGYMHGLLNPGVRELRGFTGFNVPMVPAGGGKPKTLFQEAPKLQIAVENYLGLAGGGKRLTLATWLKNLGLNDKFNPWAKRLADSEAAGDAMLRYFRHPSISGLRRLKAAKLTPAQVTREGLATVAAKALGRQPGPRSRAIRAAALLLGLAGAGYKAYDMTH